MKAKQFFVNKICVIGDKCKPLLLKILPLNFVKGIKKKLINSTYVENFEHIPYEKGKYPFGINLIGYIKAQMGLGQGCRLIAAAVQESAIPFRIMDTRVGNPFNHNDNSWDDFIRKDLSYSINIFHINPEQMPHLMLEMPEGALDRRYNIGIWLWELPDFPDEWLSAFSMVDEVWAPSKFNCESIAKKAGDKPVTLIPYGITAEFDEALNRQYFGIPQDKFLFLSMYDSNSTIERKNPIGAIRAFKKAFAADEKQVGLVVKINNPKDEDLEIINRELEGYENIYILKNTMKKIEVNSLIRDCDVFISLHRAEGFGLVIAEAMFLGTPVVATNWSANVDFMNEENSCPVDYKLQKIGNDCFVYKAYQEWAEPSIDNASEYLTRLFTDKDYYEKIKQAAVTFITEKFSVENSAKAIKERITEIMQ
ncbi:MAG: glycosyltransferase family 4 protein [Oscillospiraceae bacterium]